MNYGFKDQSLVTFSADGHNFGLYLPSDYVDSNGVLYRMPAGATSDGASTPPILWAQAGIEWLPPFGSYWRAAYLHDTAYRDTLLIWNGVSFIHATLPKASCDALLREAMVSLGTHSLTVDLIYKGVVDGGASSFEADRAKGWKAFMAPVPP